MKKLILNLIVLLFLGLAIAPSFAAAELAPPAPQSDVTVSKSPDDISVEAAISRVTNWFFVIVLIVAVIFLLVAGFQFITAGGDPDKVNSARQNVMYAMVGVAVAVLARGIVSLVQGVLGAT